MHPVEIELRNFFADHSGYYLNPLNIEIDVSEDQVNLYWNEVRKLENKPIELCINYFSNEFEIFIRDFDITSVSDLNGISPGDLWELFSKGICELFCYMSEDPESPVLTYSYQNERLVIKDDSDEEYIEGTPPENIDAILYYSLRQFEKYTAGFRL